MHAESWARGEARRRAFTELAMPRWPTLLEAREEAQNKESLRYRHARISHSSARCRTLLEVSHRPAILRFLPKITPRKCLGNAASEEGNDWNFRHVIKSVRPPAPQLRASNQHRIRDDLNGQRKSRVFTTHTLLYLLRARLSSA